MADISKILPIAPSIQFDGDGERTEFAFPFPIFDDSNLEIYIGDQLLSDGFTVQGEGSDDGGSVVFTDPPASDTTVTIRRRLPIERVTGFQESSTLRASALNSELNYLAACLQQVGDDLTRCVSLQPTDAAATLVLPPKDARGGKALGFDDDGNVIAIDANGGAATIGWKSLDDIPEGQTVRRFTASDETKLSGIQDGAQINPVQVSTTEKSAGTETAVRSLSPSDVRDMVQTHAPAAVIPSVFGRTGSVTAQSGDYSADQITDTAAKVIMTVAERAKLLDIQADAQANPVQVSVAEKSAGTETQLRSFSPADVKDIAASVSSTPVGSYFPPITAIAGDSNIVTVSADQNGKAVWVQANETPAAVTVRIPAGLPSDFCCQLVNDTAFPLAIVGYDTTLLLPTGTIATVAGQRERVWITPTPTSDTWCLDGDLVPA